MALKLKRFNPRETIEDLLPRIAPEHMHVFEIAVDDGFEIETDAHAFERIISNLIINAVRYGAPPFAILCSTRTAPWRIPRPARRFRS